MVFFNHQILEEILLKKFPLPLPIILYGSNTRVPFVFVGDTAFPLLENLIRPCPDINLIPSKIIFNYRLSRARMY